MAWRLRLATLIALPAVCALAVACGLARPLPETTTVEQRLAAFPMTGLPLEGPVTVYWDDRQIPYIEAAHDGDAAFALGLVHAHLRLGQIAIYRRVSQGRIAEMGGPLAADIDHGLRVLDYGQASDAILASMPADSRLWLERFVAGVNHYQDTVETLPFEYAALNLDREPWTARDVITFGRLAGTDVNWLVWFNLLALRHRDDWPQLWARLLDTGRATVPGVDRGASTAALGDLLAGISRSGSNSLAIAPERTTTGGAVLANDPHLGINLPNTWLIAGIKSPSYHAVGLMAPGLPLIAMGRNPWIAWGGTNMRASASDMVDVSSLAPADMGERRETIRVRGWLDRDVTIRETPWGPLLTDAPQLAEFNLPPVALRWTGHQVSDEITAMLRVARARDVNSFRDAFQSFAVPGQNMLYADTAGNIAHLLAVRVPDRSGPKPADIILTPPQADAVWTTLRNVDDLPMRLNPAEGFLASANNQPFDGRAGVGYFFSGDDRVRRMAELVTAAPVDLDDLRRFQQDVYVLSSDRLNRRLVEKIDALGVEGGASPRERTVLSLMRAWNGQYLASSRQPVAVELFFHAFIGRFYRERLGEADGTAFANLGSVKELLLADLAATPDATLRPLLQQALADAASRIDDFADWGTMHRLALKHPLHFVPIVGSRFRFVDLPVGGSTDALMKTAHSSTDERHDTRYGSNARHISDLSNPDGNYFVLLGGQDGWLNSTTFLDQVDLWREGDYIQMPLGIETVRQRFRHRMELRR